MSCNSIQLIVPEHNLCLLPGQRVKLHRFDAETWILGYGWYAWGGNREVCGWYLISTYNPGRTKPLQKPDLDDIYCVESGTLPYCECHKGGDIPAHIIVGYDDLTPAVQNQLNLASSSIQPDDFSDEFNVTPNNKVYLAETENNTWNPVG